MKSLEGKIIKVAGFPITILKYGEGIAEAKYAHGEFIAQEQKIFLDDRICTKEHLLEILLHEIKHAIFWAYHIEDTDKEERIVSILASAWVQVYKDNKWLLEYIMESLYGQSPST